jgi:hypothetical protein
MLEGDQENGRHHVMAIKTRVTAEELWRLGEGDLRRDLVNGSVDRMA